MGTTGMRECAVMVIEGDKWPIEPQAEIRVIRSQEELDALYAKARVAKHPPSVRVAGGCQAPAFRPAVRASSQMRAYWLPECAP